MYTVAAFDLDGTLLNSENAISEGNAAALRYLAARGVTLVAATARSHESAMRQFERIGQGAAAVCCAGADVRTADGAVVRQWRLPADFVRFIAELSDRVGWTATLSTGDFTFRRESPVPSWASEPRPRLRVVESLAGEDLSGLLTALIQPGPTDAHAEHLNPWRGRVALHDALSFNGERIVTATSAETDKGVGLHALCRALAVPPTEVVAFGDSAVDLPLFRAAGLSVAMANATDDVLATASLRTLSANEDGVAAAIRQIWP